MNQMSARSLLQAADLAKSFEQLEPRVLLAADPVTADHPFWAIPRGSAVVDGVLNDQGWANAFQTSRSLPYRANAGATVYTMWNDQGLFLAAEVTDEHLWADGAGSGAGNRWELEQDDSFTFYIDPDHSRDNFFQVADRAFGVNIADFEDPTNGDGPVRRYKWVKGNPDAPLVPTDTDWFGAQNGFQWQQPGFDDFFIYPGTQYKTVVNGTVNDDSDIDRGWVTEIFLPWAALNMTAPTHGQVAGMNFDLIFDDSGGTRNFADNRSLNTDSNSNGVPDRFDQPVFVDDHLLGVHSSYAASLAGLNGPVNYAVAMFVDPRAASGPAAISGMTAANTTGYSTQLVFNAPTGTTSGLGHVSGYQIRTSTSPIVTNQDWLNATELENRYVPRLAGMGERLRVIDLNPSTTYYAAVRAVDAAGNVGPLSNLVQFTTQTSTQDPSGGTRVVPSPMGRRLVTEAGDAFIAVGDHLGISWNFTRALFPGEIWDNANDQFINFNANPSVEGPAEPYFQRLEEQGVTFMRLYLELQDVHSLGNPNVPNDPNGLYWLEHTPGQYNPAMRQFMHNVLELADQHGIYILFSPFDPYSYDEAFGVEGPWASNFGGPLTNINDFFQTPGTLEIAKNRMTQLAQWADESPHGHRVLGWEPPSEWDSYEWTFNAEGDGSPAREVEFRTRANWIAELGAHIQQVDPNRIVFNSTITQDPRGPQARVIFYDRSFDALSPHFYTQGNAEPVNNPDNPRQIRPAVEQANLTSYWLTRVEDRRPLIDGEWGMSRFEWPNELPLYTDPGLEYTRTNPGLAGLSFLRAEDEAIFRTVLWSGVAAGQFGTPLRISTEELGFKIGEVDIGGGQFQDLFQGSILTDNMRAVERAIRRFQEGSSIDWARFSPDPMTGRLFATANGGQRLIAFGSTDNAQGMVYVMQDLRVAQGNVSGGQLELLGLDADAVYDISFWDAGSTSGAPFSTLSGRFSGRGDLTVALPTFTGDLVVTFVKRQGVGLRQRVVAENFGNQILTFSLGIDRQPIARITDGVTGAELEQDISALAGFRGAVNDMTAFTMPDGTINLAATDVNQAVWLFKGTPDGAGSYTWALTNLTELIGAPGLSGDLTTYQPTWGSVHIAGLDARGHAINYWFFPDATGWRFDDLTALFNGPTMTGGLTGYVASWNGLNLAGLDGDGDVIVYWWAPPLGPGNWQTLNMTELFDFTPLTGQLDAYVTNWGGLNIAGLDASGNLVTYWWSPATEQQNPGQWYEANISQAANGPAFTQGVTATTTPEGGINLLALAASGDLYLLRFDLGTLVWTSTNATAAAGAAQVAFPVSAASAGQRMVVAGQTSNASAVLGRFTFLTTDASWDWLQTSVPVVV